MEITKTTKYAGHAVLFSHEIVDSTQRTARPTTHREYSVLSCGNCPECGSTLAGDNGKFCVPDQIWWEFELGMNFPEKSKQ